MEVPYVDLPGQYQEQRDEILKAIDEVLGSGQYILGDQVDQFEEKFAKLCGVKHAISVANGTDAIIIALKALGIGEGDEVITAPNSWISSASAIALAKATPCFVDVRDDQNMDPTLLEAAITSRTKAILPVHLTGKVADMNPILEIAKKHNLHVIEDAAQAVNASYFGKKAGSMGSFGCFSLHPLKNLNAAGDAGIVTTNDDALAELVKLHRNHGIVDRDHIKFYALNSRLDTLQAAMLNIKLPYIDQVTERRRANAAIYQQELKGIVDIPTEDENCFDVYHLFVVKAAKRNELKDFLAESGVQTAIHYPTPIHLYEASRYLGYKAGDFPVVEKQSQEILSLPVHQMLSKEQILYVCDKIKEFYNK